MISLPWQVVSAAVVSQAVIVVALIFFLRDMVQARRLDQQDMLRDLRTSIRDGIELGHKIYWEQFAAQKEAGSEKGNSE